MIVTVVTIVGAVALAVSMALAYRRQGTVKAAIETVQLLQAQVTILKDELSALRVENADLRVKYDAIKEAVTQVAPVRELTEIVKNQHAEILAMLMHTHETGE